ncbi:SDR family oxidoreductase [Lutimonas sp.]|uniref:SDR family oxidoreductase n=1 Tax=Lutimonas sp. TaxID=1872403 RepID=UPI003D9BF6E3
MDKVIWITGSSSGIGKAMAMSYASQGAQLILSARNKKALEAVKSSCSNPDKIKVFPLDLSDNKDLSSVVRQAIDFFGKVDILINNAGISQRALVKDTVLEVDRQIFEVNYFGTIALTKALLPHFLDRNSGQFVVISSVVGKIGTPLRSSYSASKHALHGFYDSLRAENYEQGIKVTIICPGFVNTDVSINALTGKGEKQGTKDKATANGLSPDYFAKKAINAIRSERQEIVIGGKLELLAVYVKRFFPLVLSRMVRKVDVT